MQALNKTTTITFNAIVEGMGPENTYKKIDNTDSTLMPLVVERLYETNLGPVFSLAHYFEQNGDLCQDPEMLFIKHKSGQVIPTMFQQAIPPIYEESMVQNEDGKWGIRAKLQAEHTRFANMWLKNIKAQQRL